MIEKEDHHHRGHSKNKWHLSGMWHFTFKNDYFKAYNDSKCQINKKEFDFENPNLVLRYEFFLPNALRSSFNKTKNVLVT
jgi:hypothetical protein